MFFAVIDTGAMLVTGPSFKDRDSCIQDVQSVGYEAVHAQEDFQNAKIYCVNPDDYKDKEKVGVEDLHASDLVPEKK